LRDQCSDRIGETVCGADEKVIECYDGQYYEGNHRCCPTGSRCFQSEDENGNDVAGCSMTGAVDARCVGHHIETICDGNLLVTCDAFGFAAAEESCAGECVVDSKGRAACAFATDARCAAFENPTSWGCDGDVLFECHEGRLVWERSCAVVGATCATDAFEGAQCISTTPCTNVGERCENGNAINCQTDGTEIIEQCVGGEICDSLGTNRVWCGTRTCWR
jgi:hypothetical protein